MNQRDEAKKAKKEAMRRLRESRKETVEAATRKMKEQKKAVQAVKGQLKDGPRTVPEVAEATGIPSAEVLWWIATLKNYGAVAEGEKDGAYFRYRLTEDA